MSLTLVGLLLNKSFNVHIQWMQQSRFFTFIELRSLAALGRWMVVLCLRAIACCSGGTGELCKAARVTSQTPAAGRSGYNDRPRHRRRRSCAALPPCRVCRSVSIPMRVKTSSLRAKTNAG